MKKTLYLCGAGNPEGIRLAISINKKEARWDQIFLLDDDSTKHGQEILGVKIIGPFDMLEQATPTKAEVSNMVARTTAKRWAAGRKIAQFGLPFATLIHPLVETDGTTLGQGVTVYQNATVSTHAIVGDASAVFTGAVVGHGSRLGQCCVLAPGAVTNARVQVGDGVYLGTNASVLPDLKVGDWATIGANSVSIEDIPDGATVMGVPAEILMISAERPDGKTSTLAPAIEQPAKQPTVSVPRPVLQNTLLEIWSQILSVESLGLHDNFFACGGSSLMAVRAHRQLRQAIDVEIPLTDMYRFPTAHLLAEYLSRNTEQNELPQSRKQKGRAQMRKEARLQRQLRRQKLG